MSDHVTEFDKNHVGTEVFTHSGPHHPFSGTVIGGSLSTGRWDVRSEGGEVRTIVGPDMFGGCHGGPHPDSITCESCA